MEKTNDLYKQIIKDLVNIISDLNSKKEVPIVSQKPLNYRYLYNKEKETYSKIRIYVNRRIQTGGSSEASTKTIELLDHVMQKMLSEIKTLNTMHNEEFINLGKLSVLVKDLQQSFEKDKHINEDILSDINKLLDK